MSKQEEKIKTYLHMIGMQQQLQSTFYSPRNKQAEYSRYDSFQHISDWDNKRKLSIQNSSSLPKLQNNKRNYSQSMELSKYQSQLLKNIDQRRKQESLFLNPVDIKFTAKISGNSLRRSRLLFHRILHDEGIKKGEDPTHLRDILKSLKSNDEPKIVAASPLKTERCSGILRMLKRREPIRLYKKKKHQPQALQAIKLH